MHIRLLGTAAGGGVPQWNCACRQCVAARAGEIPARTQSSVAFSADGKRWFLINASPDLRAQIEGFPPLHPAAGNSRESPLQGVLLTNADLDHVLGLLLLREGGDLWVMSPGGVQAALRQSLHLPELFGSFARLEMAEAPTVWAPLLYRDGSRTSLQVRAHPLSSEPPPYALPASAEGVHSVAYELCDTRTGGTVVIAPDVGEITPALAVALQEADLSFFDGTFWSDDELQALKPGARSARAMGHLPIGEGSLLALQALRTRQTIYLHINNTNPILDPNTRECALVRAAGLKIGADGEEFTV